MPSLFDFVINHPPCVPFCMARARGPEVIATQPSQATDVDAPGSSCSYRLGPFYPHLASRCPIISVKDHRPSEARMMLRASSPSPLVNLTGATASGFWAFRNPTGVFVFELAMTPMNGGGFQGSGVPSNPSLWYVPESIDRVRTPRVSMHHVSSIPRGLDPRAITPLD